MTADLSCKFRALDKGGYNAGRKNYQFEFPNGEVLSLKAAIKREKNGACSDFSE